MRTRLRDIHKTKIGQVAISLLAGYGIVLAGTVLLCHYFGLSCVELGTAQNITAIIGSGAVLSEAFMGLIGK